MSIDQWDAVAETFLRWVGVPGAVFAIAYTLLRLVLEISPAWRLLSRGLRTERRGRSRIRVYHANLWKFVGLMATSGLPGRRTLRDGVRLAVERQLLPSATLRDDDGHQSPVLALPSFVDIYHAEPRLKKYFALLRRLYGSTAWSRRSYALIEVSEVFLAPLHLVGGLLPHFSDDWHPVIEAYERAVADPSEPLLSGALRRIQVSQFKMWLLWGPSIPICTCSQWDPNVFLQVGYGDENNSIVAWGDGLMARVLDLENTTAERKTPLALGVRLIGRLAWTPALLEARTFCRAQETLGTEGGGRFVLECHPGREREVLEQARYTRDRTRRFYTAYVWVLFVICDEKGSPLDSPDVPHWLPILPFYEHANIAEWATYEDAKHRLASSVVNSLKRYADAGWLDGLNLAYACAIDDTGCSSRQLIPDRTPRIIDLIAEELRALDKRAVASSVTMPLIAQDDGAGRHHTRVDPAIEAFCACHLGERLADHLAASLRRERVVPGS